MGTRNRDRPYETQESDENGLVPRDQAEYDERLSAAAIRAARKVAANQRRFERSTSLFARTCRALGIGYWDLIAITYPVYCQAKRVQSWMRSIARKVDGDVKT